MKRSATNRKARSARPEKAATSSTSGGSELARRPLSLPQSGTVIATRGPNRSVSALAVGVLVAFDGVATATFVGVAVMALQRSMKNERPESEPEQHWDFDGEVVGGESPSNVT